MSGELSATPKTIQEVGSNNYGFIVPAYQREYVWDAKKNFLKLLQDIYDEWQENPRLNNDTLQSKYFIGSIITVQGKNSPRHEVVDGQQRLTSIFIFLAAFTKYISEQTFTEKVAIANKNRYQNLINDIILTTNQDDIKLHLQYEGTDYLKHLILSKKYEGSKKESQSVKRMANAYSTAYKFIRDQLANQDIWSFINYFLKNVQLLVVVDSTNFANSLKIFETINNTGVSLKGMDLVKNLIFMNATMEEYKVITPEWKDIIINLKNCGEEQKPSRFLRYFIIARYFDQSSPLTEENIYNWITAKDKGRKIISYDKNPLLFVNEMKWYSELYSSLVIATTNSGKDAEQKIAFYPWLYNIGLLNSSSIRQHIIIFLSIKQTLISTDSKKKKLINAIAQQIEKLLFWYQLSSVQPKEIEIKFQALAKIIREQSTEASLITSITTFYAKEIKSMDNPSWDIINSWTHSKIRYFLLRIENSFRRACSLDEIPIDTQVSLEHIFPQTPLNNREPFANYGKSVNNLGNYTLLETNYNSSIAKENDVLSTQWFKKKSSVYENSEYLITKILSPNRKSSPRSKVDKFLSYFPPTLSWNNDAVKERREKFIKFAEIIWK